MQLNSGCNDGAFCEQDRLYEPKLNGFGVFLIMESDIQNQPSELTISVTVSVTVTVSKNAYRTGNTGMML